MTKPESAAVDDELAQLLTGPEAAIFIGRTGVGGFSEVTPTYVTAAGNLILTRRDLVEIIGQMSEGDALCFRGTQDSAETRDPTIGKFFDNRLIIDYLSHRVRIGGITHEPPPKPFNVLALLARKFEQTVNRETIALTVWGHTSVAHEGNSITVCIGRIRKLLGPELSRHLVTEPRHGYRLSAEVPKARKKARE